MPLTEPVRTLETNPRSVQDARRWIASACHELGRDDLVDAAALGISELVTNALLHAAPPIQVRLRGTAQHPRVEVSDGSTAPPVPTPRIGDDDEALLTTIGRGLTMVAMCSQAWGTYLQSDGKTVWFEPLSTLLESPATANETSTDLTYDPVVDRVGEDEGRPVTLAGFPIELYQSWWRHFLDLQRELRLLALAHEAAYPVARQLTDLFTAFADEVRRSRGLEDGDPTLDAHGNLTIRVSDDAPEVMAQMIEVLELADAFCHAERMLTAPTTPSQLAFQRWFLGECVNQAAGAAPQPWTAPSAR